MDPNTPLPYNAHSYQIREALLNRLGEDEDYSKLDRCSYCDGRQYACNCEHATNTERQRVRKIIEEVLG